MSKKDEKKSGLEIKKGIVGFFDILGYTAFLKNNSAEDGIREVFEIIVNAEKNCVNKFKHLFGKTVEVDEQFEDELWAFIDNDTNWLIFSDTILLTLAYNNEDSIREKYNKWMLFMWLSVYLNMDLLLSGLPLRGAIAFGNYAIRENCFAGQPIVDAYELTQELDLSASVFTESAENESDKIYSSVEEVLTSANAESSPSLMREFFTDYLVPLKNKESSKLRTLDYLKFTSPKYTNDEMKDVRQFVLEQFWKHDKDIPESAQSKVDNTEQFLRFLKQRRNQAE